MIDTVLRLGILLAIFASMFVVSQLVLNAAWSRRAHLNMVNRRMRMISEGRSREQVVAILRKNDASDYSHLPPLVAKRLTALQLSLRASALPLTMSQLLFLMIGGFFAVLALIALVAVFKGFPLSVGIIALALAVAFSFAILLPSMALGIVAQRRRRKIEEQFPVSLDVFVRALRAGHPVASAIDLLTREMPDPIGSEFGLVADEVAYGAELTDSLAAMAERWNLEDIRMFVVSLSVQSETGGNLAEILENLADVIRARASLYRKVRALSSEGRMTGWMLTILPVAAFVGLFTINPGFYLAVARDPMFLIGFGLLVMMYLMGLMMIRSLVNIKV